MPVNVKEEGEYEGLSGTFKAKPASVADKVVEGKEGRPDALRVIFEVEDQDKTLSLFVPIHADAVGRLRPFIPGLTSVTATEAGLRDLIAAMPTDAVTVYANNGSIWSRVAEVGVHRAELSRLMLFTRASDNETRARFVLETPDNTEISWTAPWKVKASRGTTPDKDDITVSLNDSVFQYLCTLGLDARWFEVEMSEAYQKGTLFARLGLDGQVPGFFEDPADITPELLAAVERHGKRQVQVEIVDHPQYGLGPKRAGQIKMVQLAPVVVEGAGNVEFDRELLRFYEDWDNLTRVLLARDDARFLIGGKLTGDGRPIAMAVMVPAIQAYPDAVKERKADGTPAIVLPPTLDSWKLNGLVCVNFLAERLMAAGPETLFELVNLGDPNPEKLLVWIAENVKEFASDMDADEGGETL